MSRVKQFLRPGWPWKAAFVLYIAAVAYLCFGSGDDLPSVTFSLFGIPADKLGHFLMFLPFCPLAFLAFSPLRVKSWRCAGILAIITLCGAAMAFGTELVQYFLPTRAMEMKDFAADSAAIVLGSLGSFLCLPCGGRSQTR
ncbi:MAG: VanZ family protein [Bacteroidales bacterium]|nr:VanZ family protein [Candidatus Cryptobacteroides aphodequi]